MTSSFRQPISVLLFDVDGCLLDSTLPIVTSMNATLVGADLAPIDGDEYRQYVGPPLLHSLELLLESRHADPALATQLVDRYREQYEIVHIAMAATYTGVRELLEELDGRIRMAVVTSKPAVYATPILEELRFASMMEFIEGPTIDEAEPKTNTLRRAIARLGTGVSSHDIVMIGDRRYDIEAAKANGIHAVGVTWGFGDRQELDAAGADFVVDSPSDIATLVSGNALSQDDPAEEAP